MFPYEVTFVDAPPSPFIQAKIDRQMAKWGRLYERIVDGRVTVHRPHRHHGLKHFHIHIQLDVPGRKIVVSRETERNPDHANIHLAMRDAFAKVTRQLESFVKLRTDYHREKKFAEFSGERELG